MSESDLTAKIDVSCQITQHQSESETFSDSERKNYSFPRSARLLTAADYSGVFKRNQRFSDRYWTILVHKSEEGNARLGLAIAKKRAKRAVDRNKIKRVARESFRVHSEHMAGLELVIMNRDAAATENLVALRKSIDSLCRKIITKYR